VREVIAQAFVTLDGVMEKPENWSFQFYNEDHLKHSEELLAGADALLMGRATYNSFANAWPSRSGELADKINSMTKYVYSRSLKTPLEWTNCTLIEGDVAKVVSDLKQQPGQNILIYGCGEIPATLARNGLLDELQLWIHPLSLGQGERIFKGATGLPAFDTIDAETLSSGAVILRLKPRAAS
jgi:dihydrofolate reductase